nr:hypothetical protein Iba_chr14bCG12940 [Ipomoea batatas]GMD92146.1 hypothetical protein Iba_chr14eCG6310 [Ipomoea batatas]
MDLLRSVVFPSSTCSISSKSRANRYTCSYFGATTIEIILAFERFDARALEQHPAPRPRDKQLVRTQSRLLRLSLIEEALASGRVFNHAGLLKRFLAGLSAEDARTYHSIETSDCPANVIPRPGNDGLCGSASHDI